MTSLWREAQRETKCTLKRWEELQEGGGVREARRVVSLMRGDCRTSTEVSVEKLPVD